MNSIEKNYKILLNINDNKMDEAVATVLLPADVEIVNFEDCDKAGFAETQTFITTRQEVEWTNIQLAVESSINIEEYESPAKEDTPADTLAFDDESTLVTEEYTTQYILVQDEEEFDENGSEQETPFILFEDGTVKCIDEVLLLQQDDETEEVTAYTKTSGKKLKTNVCKYGGCRRAFASPHHLKVHERGHTNERPYKCTAEGCSREFNTAYSQKAHARTHTGEKPYVCKYGCNKGFKTSGDLAKHIRTHTGERPFMCPLEGCDKTFVTSNACKVHVRVHTGEKPYVCPAEGCERSFSCPTNFKNHVRIHTGEKPYTCSVKGCNRKFTEYSSLYKHRLVHSPAKSYSCTFCSKVYRQLSSLRTHKRTVHGFVVSSDGSELLLEEIISTLDTST